MRMTLPRLLFLGVLAATCKNSARSQEQPKDQYSPSLRGTSAAALAHGRQGTASQAQHSAPPGQDGTQETDAPPFGTISGTILDMNGNPIPGAPVVLQGPDPGDQQTAMADKNGSYEFQNVSPGRPYHVIVTVEGFREWTSPAVILNPGQFQILPGSQLQLEEVVTTVTVTPKTEAEIATEQVNIEERQRVLGIVPNFFESFEPHPSPLSTKLKYSLSFRVVTDPFTIASMAILAAPLQAQGTPRYGDGMKGFGQRMGASYANQFTDIMIGGAILPSLLHQDPRYYYQGTGSAKSRALHAISNPFITMGDDGHLQFNASSLGGDLASAAISNTYYPESSEGTGLIFENFSINVGVHMAVRLLQEFAFHPRR